MSLYNSLALNLNHENNKFLIIAEKVSKSYIPGHYIFSNINVTISSGDIFSITGPNGSGKSTLLRILNCNLRHSSGNIQYFIGDNKIEPNDLYKYSSFVAPYLNLYDEFTPLELTQIIAKIKGKKFELDKINQLLSTFNLYHRRNDLVRTFSSGMKQRLKFVIALSVPSRVLFLDEPTSNLDNQGITVVFNKIFDYKSKGNVVIIATNEEREKSICNKNLALG